MLRILLTQAYAPLEGGSDNATSLFNDQNWYSLDKTLILSFFVLKHSDKALTLLLMHNRVAQKCNFVILRIKLDVKLRSVYS